MAVLESTGVSLTSDFYMRNFYKYNKNAMKKSSRVTFSGEEKSYEDSRALQRAARKISSYKFDEDDNRESLISTITAYVETYNNTLDSAAETSDKDVARFAKKLKSYTAQYSSELADLGITIEDNGKMTINKDYLKDKEVEDLKKVFDPENGYLKDIKNVSKKIFDKVHFSLYSQLTGNGARLNVTV